MNTFKLRLNHHAQQTVLQNTAPAETETIKQHEKNLLKNIDTDSQQINKINLETPAKEPKPAVGKISKRPSKPEDKKKLSVIRVYCTEKDKKLFQEFCSIENISESSYLEKYVKKANRAFKNNRLD